MGGPPWKTYLVVTGQQTGVPGIVRGVIIGNPGSGGGAECPPIGGTGLNDPSAWTPTVTGDPSRASITSTGMSVTHTAGGQGYSQIDNALDVPIDVPPGCGCFTISLSWTLNMVNVTGGTGQVAIVADVSGSTLASADITHDTGGSGFISDSITWVFAVDDPIFGGVSPHITLQTWVLDNTVGSAAFGGVSISLGPC